MNKWEELLKKCGFVWVNVDLIPFHKKPDDYQTRYWYAFNHWICPDGGKDQNAPPATLDNIFKYVVIKVPVLDRPALLTRWVWRMYVPEVDGDPVNDLIDILYEAII